MKKLIAVLFSAAMLLCLCACGGAGSEVTAETIDPALQGSWNTHAASKLKDNYFALEYAFDHGTYTYTYYMPYFDEKEGFVPLDKDGNANYTTGSHTGTYKIEITSNDRDVIYSGVILLSPDSDPSKVEDIAFTYISNKKNLKLNYIENDMKHEPIDVEEYKKELVKRAKEK